MLDDAVQFSLTTSAESLKTDPDALGLDILRLLLFSVNWPDQVDTNEKAQELRRKGYLFNGWS